MIRFNSVDFKIPKQLIQKPIISEVTGRSINGTGYRDILYFGKNEYEVTFPFMTETEFNTLMTYVYTPSLSVESTIVGSSFNLPSAQVRLAGDVEHGYSASRREIKIIISEN